MSDNSDEEYIPSSLMVNEQEQIQTVTICGLVTNVVDNEITIKGKGKLQNIVNLYDSTICNGDYVWSECAEKGGCLFTVRQPLVEIPLDNEGIKEHIRLALKVSEKKSSEIFASFSIDAEKYSKDKNDKNFTILNYLSLLSIGKIRPEIKNIKEVQLNDFIIYWKKNYLLRKLHNFGLNDEDIKRCKLDPERLYEQIRENPYVIPQLSMEKCFLIMELQGKEIKPIDITSGKILRAVYDKLKSSQWTSYPIKMIEKKFPDMNLNYLVKNFNMVYDLECLYLKKIHNLELRVTNFSIDTKKIKTGYVVMKKFDKELTNEQTVAVESALKSRISCITGSAGTGKSRIIKEIVNILIYNGLNYQVCSFTGKAVARLRELMSKDNYLYLATIHKILWSKESNDSKGVMLEAKYVIIDEASMIDMSLFVKLINKYSIDDDPPCFILIGDVNQLPPIKYGQIFKSFIDNVDTFRLSKCLRTEDDGFSDIITKNSNKIVNDDDDVELVETDNFMLIDKKMKEVLKIVAILKNDIEDFQEKDFKVITAYNEDCEKLNEKIQNIFRGKAQYIEFRGKKWCIGDKIMMCENDYDGQIMNGEEGVISKLVEKKVFHFNDGKCVSVYPDDKEYDYEVGEKVFVNVKGKSIYLDNRSPVMKVIRRIEKREGVQVDFDGKLFSFYAINTEKKKFGVLSNNMERSISLINHSYCITTHKSQGSEWKIIIFYVPDKGNSSFINKNLVYTAFTRAKKIVYCVGNMDVLSTGINTAMWWKCDKLNERLRNL